MKKNENDKIQQLLQDVTTEKSEPDGYPVYPEKEDIYNKFRKEKSIDPEDIDKTKELVIVRKENELDFSQDIIGSDLDIPEFESNDTEEVTEMEDEENSYFSLGGDDHNDLEENLGY